MIAHSFSVLPYIHCADHNTRFSPVATKHLTPVTRQTPNTTRRPDLTMADSQDPTLPEADQVCIGRWNTNATAILTPYRFVRSVLPSSEVLQVPHQTRRHHRLDHQYQHPQSRTQYLRHRPDHHQRQPLLGLVESITHNEHQIPAHLKRTYNLELCRLSSAKEMGRNGQSQRQQERRRKPWSHGKTRCCDRCSGLH